VVGPMRLQIGLSSAAFPAGRTPWRAALPEDVDLREIKRAVRFLVIQGPRLVEPLVYLIESSGSKPLDQACKVLIPDALRDIAVGYGEVFIEGSLVRLLSSGERP